MLLLSLGILLLAIAVGTNAQVLLTYNQLGHALTVRCEVRDIQLTQVPTPISLSLFREVNGTDAMMVSLPLSSGDEAKSLKILDMQGATKAKSGVFDAMGPYYLELIWSKAISSLEGDYKCSLAGLDKLHRAVNDGVTERVILTDFQPVFTASTQEIRVDLTSHFSLRCSFGDFATHDVSMVQSVNLFHARGEVFDLLASVTIFSPAHVVLPGQNRAVVSGSVDGPEAYLELSWEYPKHRDAGPYTCRVIAHDLRGNPKSFSHSLNVTAVDSSRDELSGRIMSLETKLVKVETALSHLKATCHNVNQELIHTGQEKWQTNHAEWETSQESGQTSQEEEETSQELEKAKQELLIISQELIATSQELRKTREELEKTKQELAVKSQKLTRRNQELKRIRNELLSAVQELEETKEEMKSLQSPQSCEAASLTPGEHVVRLIPDNRRDDPVDVICEAAEDGTVWTVFQRRSDHVVDFNRSYTEYENGFGSLEGEFWLGLKNIVRLMANGSYELQADLVLKGKNYTRVYPTFALDPDDFYKLTVGGNPNDAGFGLSYNNGMTFYTYDRDNPSACAHRRGGGWWYKNCSHVNLNGKAMHYGQSGFRWFDLDDSYHVLSASKMKFRKKKTTLETEAWLV